MNYIDAGLRRGFIPGSCTAQTVESEGNPCLGAGDRAAWPAESIRRDNEPGTDLAAFLGWCEQRKTQLIHIQPGRPMQNGQLEIFNRPLRDEGLNANWFLETGGRAVTLLDGDLVRKHLSSELGFPKEHPRHS
jgi:transposase InsO family protein